MSAAGVSEPPSARGGAAAAAGMMRPRPHTALPRIVLVSAFPFKISNRKPPAGTGGTLFLFFFFPLLVLFVSFNAFGSFWWATPTEAHTKISKFYRKMYGILTVGGFVSVALR